MIGVALGLAKLVPTRVWAGLAVSVALAGGAWYLRHGGVVAGRAEVQVKWDTERLDIARQTLRIIEVNTRKSGDLQAKADKEREATRAHFNSIDLEHAERIRRLQNRPDRPAPSGAGVPPTAEPGAGGSGCTGASLYKSDGEFLSGEVAAARRLQIALAACYRQYDAAERAVNAQ